MSAWLCGKIHVISSPKPWRKGYSNHYVINIWYNKYILILAIRVWKSSALGWCRRSRHFPSQLLQDYFAANGMFPSVLTTPQLHSFAKVLLCLGRTISLAKQLRISPIDLLGSPRLDHELRKQCQSGSRPWKKSMVSTPLSIYCRWTLNETSIGTTGTKYTAVGRLRQSAQLTPTIHWLRSGYCFGGVFSIDAASMDFIAAG